MIESEQDTNSMHDLLEKWKEDDKDQREEVRVGAGAVQIPGLRAPVRRPMAWPDPFQARANHYVVWLSEQPFTIAFSYPRPNEGANVLESVRFPQADADFPDATFFAVAKMRVDSASGHPYKYTLTVLDEEGGNTLRTVDPGGHVDRDPKFG